MSANLFDIFAGRISDPSRIAIETVTGERCSYADVVTQSGKLASALASLGVVPGDRVAVQVEKSVPALMLYLAAARAGAVFLPLNTAYTLAELDYFIGDAEPKVVVCDPAKEEGLIRIAPVGTTVVTLGASGRGSLTDQAGRSDPEFRTVARSKDDLAAILYPSGTTGRSKGAMQTH
jgi:malonyl-CoA/methylmalonyl-CoA synthetase